MLSWQVSVERLVVGLFCVQLLSSPCIVGTGGHCGMLSCDNSLPNHVHQPHRISSMLQGFLILEWICNASWKLEERIAQKFWNSMKHHQDVQSTRRTNLLTFAFGLLIWWRQFRVWWTTKVDWLLGFKFHCPVWPPIFKAERPFWYFVAMCCMIRLPCSFQIQSVDLHRPKGMQSIGFALQMVELQLSLQTAAQWTRTIVCWLANDTSTLPYMDVWWGFWVLFWHQIRLPHTHHNLWEKLLQIHVSPSVVTFISSAEGVMVMARSSHIGVVIIVHSWTPMYLTLMGIVRQHPAWGTLSPVPTKPEMAPLGVSRLHLKWHPHPCQKWLSVVHENQFVILPGFVLEMVGNILGNRMKLDSFCWALGVWRVPQDQGKNLDFLGCEA